MCRTWHISLSRKIQLKKYLSWFSMVKPSIKNHAKTHPKLVLLKWSLQHAPPVKLDIAGVGWLC